MPHIFPTSANEATDGKIKDFHPVFHNDFAVSSVSRNTTKRFTAHRPEETICCLRARLICCSLLYHLGLEAGGYFMCFFYSLPHARQDLYDSKLYCFCLHSPLQSTQNQSSWGALILRTRFNVTPIRSHHNFELKSHINMRVEVYLRICRCFLGSILVSHTVEKLLERPPISIRYPKPHSGLAPSLSKGFAAVTVPIGFKVHRTACISVSTLTDRSYSLKGDLKVIL